MPTRRILIFTACALVVTGGFISRGMAAAPAVTADATPKTFVTKIYDSYKGKNSKGISIAGEAEIQRYFEPSLAAMIIKDGKAAAKRKDAPSLDFDPFIDGQEWELADVNVAVSDAPPDKAVATVTFKNFGMPTKIVVNLVRTKSDWRIANITWERDGNPETLRGLFKH